MDEETKAYLDAMMAQIYDQFERVVGLLAAVRSDIHSMSGHLIHATEDWQTLSRRVTRLEEEVRRPRKD
jgi:hypothetical protein